MGKFGLHYLKAYWQRLRNPLLTVNEDPVLLLGNQKSGTTAISKLLALRCDCSVQLDIEALWEPYCTQILEGELDLEEWRDRNRRFFSSDLLKEPNFSLLYEPLRTLYPEARYVLIVRDPRDNLRSILNRLGLPGDLEKLSKALFANVNPHWAALFDPENHDAPSSQYIDVLAARWNLCADIYLRHPEDVLLFRYEDFLQDKVGALDGLARQLDLTPSRDIFDKLDVQYQPAGNRSIPWREFFGNRNLGRIMDICGENMEQLGYPTSSIDFPCKKKETQK